MMTIKSGPLSSPIVERAAPIIVPIPRHPVIGADIIQSEFWPSVGANQSLRNLDCSAQVHTQQPTLS